MILNINFLRKPVDNSLLTSLLCSAAGRVYQSVIRRWDGDNHQQRSQTSDTQNTFSSGTAVNSLLQHCSTDPDLVVTSGLRRSNALINVLNMTDTIQSDYRVTGSLLTASCWPTLLPDFSDIFSSAAMRFVCPECRALGCWERT